MTRIALPFFLLTGLTIWMFAEANTFPARAIYGGQNKADATRPDTIPPVEERYDDFITNPNSNPFDLKDPSIIEQTVDYDPETGRYIIQEKIGDDYFRPPTYMTFEEYIAWQRKKEERAYFDQLAGVSTGGTVSATDPLARFDTKTSMLDRLFGGTTVDIRPRGGIDLTFGVDFQRLDNPILTERQRRTGGFDFDMAIQMDVTGKIGEKLTLTTSYNNNATFNFDNKIKLDYNSDAFGEDDIIKKIEAGNVSLPLRGSLIQGAQSLFGLKTELQFGNLRLTAIASQQNSQNENIQLKGGSQLQEFEVKADEYDENRHFFLSHYNRDAFEGNLRNLPQINTLFHLENIEVWITNDRNVVEDVRDIVAFADLGEPTKLVNPTAIPPFATPRFREIGGGRGLPENDANGLYRRLLDREEIRSIDRSVSILQSQEFGLQQSKDFEKVSARKLDAREYTVHPDLGTISVNINVQPDQVLAVAYQYKYNGNIYKVGELSVNTDAVGTDTSDRTPQVLYVKMLKSTTQRTDVPTWDLMMKNVYSIGAFQVNREDFKLDIFYEDPGKGFKRFLPNSNLEGRPLIRVFNLDNLNVQGDPQPDGVFDFVPGVTINPTNGRIMFPLLEPFGSGLANQITDANFRDSFVYQELYDLTLFQAQEFPEKNRYAIRGSYKSTSSSEISLGAFNIPQGSVTVTAGGQKLVEGSDFEVDYGTGRVKILNDAIIASGVPVNVSFEDNTVFGFQTKAMIGLRADYKISDNLSVGATFLQLFERPFTQKVNIGDDPIRNRIYGLDLNLSRDAPWLTKAVDKLPFFSTKAASSINFTAEGAYLKPGHSKAINENRKDKGGVVYVDDFEGSTSSFDLRQPTNQWFLASVPQNDDQNNNPLFPEANVSSLAYGANRALLNWYRIDPSARTGDDVNNPYTSQVPQQEVFPNLRTQQTDISNIGFTFDLSYSPRERGPYNFDLPDGYPGLTRGLNIVGDSLTLRDPNTRWGGIMRALNNTNDFQAANIEFLEFWMLSPFLDPTNAAGASLNADGQQGTLYINLGNVSEDILKDSRKAFENGLPTTSNSERRVDQTLWGKVPAGQQITRAFDNDLRNDAREIQDVGLDGLSDLEEREKFGPYLNAIAGVNGLVAAKLQNDPSNDNFRYYRDPSFTNTDGVLQRYRDFNNTQGNSQSNEGNDIRQSGTNIPDAEDINQDNTLNETESYFQYKIPLRVDPNNRREIDANQTPFITDRIEDPTTRRVWYRFRIPLNGPDKVSVGGIRDFRSIRFMRMYMRDFQEPVVLRFARLELVRNQWRRYTQDLTNDEDIVGVPDNCGEVTTFDVDAVNIEENSQRTPFSYTLPEGIQREQSLGVFQALQNEQSLSMRISDLCDGDARAIFKITEVDMRLYERLKMFVHAEAPNNDIQPGELKIFMRLGSDFKNNYYEYEIPLVMSNPDNLPINSNDPGYKQEVWRAENEFDFPLELLRKLKEARNAAGFNAAAVYAQAINPSDPNSRVIKVKGSPNLGFVKMVMIGVRNPYQGNSASYDAEVWINELRLTGLDERGGTAALARLDMQLADLGNVTVAGNYNSVGFGALDQQVHERSREEVVGYDVATTLELGKFLPEKWGVKVPFYAQISNTTRTPEYNPYDLDLIVKDQLKSIADEAKRDSVREQSQEVTSIKSYTFTNVRKERTNAQAPPMPWDISNFSLSYGYSQTDRSDPIIQADQQKRYTGGLDYGFNRRVKYWEPFKGIKDDKYLKLIKEFNVNPLPNSFTFSTLLDRSFSRTSYRFAGVDERFNTFFNKRFLWERQYNLQWDITKALKFNFNSSNSAVIDEPNEITLLENQPMIGDINKFRRDSIWNNIRKLGRPKQYRHNFNVTYTLPIRHLPFMDWVQVRAQYQAEYSWSAAALNVDSLGNVIQNSQNRQIGADLNFDKLYSQFAYLRAIEKPASAKTKGKTTGKKEDDKKDNVVQKDDPDAKKDPKAKAKERVPSGLERALVRPLLMLRKAKLNYNERFRTVVPGFMPRSKLLGMESGFGAPGWDFIAGGQPRIRTLTQNQRENPSEGNGDWLYDNRQWITSNVFFNQDIVQDYTKTYDAQVTLEPFRDFRVTLEMNKSFTENFTETFKDTTYDAFTDYVHVVPTTMGSMTVSYSALKTLFKDSQGEILNLFKQYEANRVIISERLGTGTHSDPNLAEQGYTDGYGRTQQEVLIPAFISAYTGSNPRTTGLDIFKTQPNINWRLSYNGLSKIPLFKEIFTNFSLTHGYKTALNVNSYRTGLDYQRTRPIGSRDEISGNFYARLEIPEVVIQEAFSPLIAVEATLVNGMSFNVDFKKSRTLAMSFVNRLLSETQTKELIIGGGYRLRDFDIPFLTGSKKKGNKKKKEEEEKKKQQANPTSPQSGRGNGQLQIRDLDMQFNFSLRDDVTFAHKLDEGIFEPTRGSYALSISPSAEYKLSRRLSLRLFFDYRRTIPKTSQGFPRTDTSGGLVVRFQLD